MKNWQILMVACTASLLSLSQCKKREIFTEADAEKMCSKMAECLEPHMKMMREQMNQIPPSMRANMPQTPTFDRADCMKKSSAKTARTQEGRELTEEELMALKRCHERIVASSCQAITGGIMMTSPECSEWMKISKNIK